MRAWEIKDLKTAELLEKYPNYRAYKEFGAKEGGWSATTLSTRYGSWNKAKEKLTEQKIWEYNSMKHDFSYADIVECIKSYRSRDEWVAARKSGVLLPSERQIVKLFGSWSKAKSELGFKKIGAALDPEKPTTVYMLWFVEEDIFKVGITQRTIDMRFQGYPEYAIVDSRVLPLDDARALEKATLEKYKDTRGTPKDPVFRRGGKGGFTECFYCSEVPVFPNNT